MNEGEFIIRAELPSGDYLEARLYNEDDAKAVAHALYDGGIENVKLYVLGALEVEF